MTPGALRQTSHVAPRFLPGLQLSGRFFEEAVRPILETEAPGLVYSAARVGSGSEVLGYDSERSVDHEWGPRLQVFVADDEEAAVGGRLTIALSERLPKEFLGWPTHFEPAGADIRRMAHTDGPVRHRVDVISVGGWCADRLGFDARREVTVLDWLATPGQRLAEAVGGAVFHDGLGQLLPLRKRLEWYDDDVWRFLLASQWQRIAQEEAFPGRCAEVGDELGSRMVTARLVREVMRLWLLMERRYPPYTKWLGTAFASLPGTSVVAAGLGRALGAATWEDREGGLCSAYRETAERHNRLGLTSPLDSSPRSYFGRPYDVIDGGRFAAALRETIGDPALRTLPLVGGVDQFLDSTDVLSHPQRARAAAAALLPDLA